ncbi:hypothetical protein ACI6M9_003291 [Escherichia coli]
MRHNYLIMPVMPLPAPDVVRRFVPRTVVHWLCLLMILFMRHSDRGDIDKCHERCNSDPHPTPEIRSRG